MKLGFIAFFLLIATRLSAQECHSAEHGDVNDRLDLASDWSAWSAVLRFDAEWRPATFRYLSGRIAGQVLQLSDDWLLVSRSADGYSLAMGSSTGRDPTGRWYFFGEAGRLDWVVERVSNRWEVKLSPCPQIARVQHKNMKQNWELMCLDAAGHAEGAFEIRNNVGIQLRRGAHKAGARVGTWFANDDAGCGIWRRTYRDGKLNGPSVEWSADGHIRRQGSYEMGTPVGQWKGSPCLEGDYLAIQNRCFP